MPTGDGMPANTMAVSAGLGAIPGPVGASGYRLSISSSHFCCLRRRVDEGIDVRQDVSLFFVGESVVNVIFAFFTTTKVHRLVVGANSYTEGVFVHNYLVYTWPLGWNKTNLTSRC